MPGGDQLATYSYVCKPCGPFEVRAAIGEASDSAVCPTCRKSARRVFSPPMLYRTPAAIAGLYEEEERSRDSPRVVDRITGTPRRRQRYTHNPLHRKLPRP
jgi:putative FmdB family regulatory protein